MIIGLVVIVAIGAVLLTLQDWRRGIVCLAAWLLLEGTFRRLAPQTALGVFLFKDVLVLLLFVSYAVIRARSAPPSRTRAPWPVLVTPVVLLLAVSIVHSVNPKLPSAVVGLFGLKAYFLYVPLVILGFHLFRSESRIIDGLAAFALTTVITVGVAVQQIFFPSGGFEAARGGLYYYRLHTTESLDILLPTSIFTGELRFASHALLCTFLSLGLVGSVYSTSRGERDRRLTLLAWFAFLSSLASVFLTGKNLAIILAGVLIPACAVTMLWFRRRNAFAAFPWKRTVAAIATVMIVIATTMPERTKLVAEYFWFRVTTGGLQEEGTRGVIRELASISQEKGLLGIGLGPFTQGIGTLAGFGGFTDPAAFRFHEGSLPKVVIELGVLGGFLWMWLTAAIIGLAFISMKRTAPTLRPVAIGIFAYLVAWLVYAWKSHAFYDDPFQQIPLWLMLGVLMHLGYRPAPRMDAAATDAEVVPVGSP